ncbi:hypothetical protein, partial [Adlercreutzia sp. DFI.6.23]|uniref:hypothetical protein n=1 Tax=Adlercreutzia sp. DFI.6.23 TaxID=2963705 RepID=UPI00210BC460
MFDEAELRQNFSDFRRALADHWSPYANVAYSVKTNPFPWILEVARDEAVKRVPMDFPLTFIAG